MNKQQRPALGNLLAILNLVTTVYFLGLTAISVLYKRVGSKLDIDSELAYSFLSFGMEPPLLVIALLLAISITCFMFALKSGPSGTVGVGLSITPDLVIVVFCVLTLADLVPWEYTNKPKSVIAPLCVFLTLFLLKLMFMAQLVGTDYYPKAQRK